MKRNLELEAAIVAKPHDLAVYLVYADWLTEQGDPRGELIRVQAEGVPSAPPKYTEHMARMNALRDAHLASWLGDLAGKALHRLHFLWSLGFFSTASVRPPKNATDAPSKDVVAAVLACPLALVLKELTIYGRVREIVDATPPCCRQRSNRSSCSTTRATRDTSASSIRCARNSRSTAGR